MQEVSIRYVRQIAGSNIPKGPYLNGFIIRGMDALERIERRLAAFKESRKGKKAAIAASGVVSVPIIESPHFPKFVGSNQGTFKYSVKQAIEESPFTRLISVVPSEFRKQLCSLIENISCKKEAIKYLELSEEEAQKVFEQEGIYFPA